MIDFLQAVIEFPTVVFTMLLGVVAIYWLFVVLGAIEHSVLDHFAGATDAVGHASDGLVDGIDAGVGHHAGHGLLVDVLDALGVRGVPLTVWLSIVILLSWAFSLLGMQSLGAAMATVIGHFGAGAIVAVVALVAAVAAASIVVRPLKRLNTVHTAIGHKSLVGKTCTVTTLRVDGGFGQAEIDDGGAGLLVQVRCLEANDLTRGSKALIFEYDPETGVFNVARFDDAPEVRDVERRLRTPE